MMKKIFDVAIIGSGPAALTAATYTSRENLSTVIIEKGVMGGLMATIDQVDNYPGHSGVPGLELAKKFTEQAKNFGATIERAEVTKITKNAPGFIVTTDGDKISAKTVLIATGGAYKKLGIPGEQNAHYCATCDGPFYRDKKLIVIGGANAAVQEAIFLSKFATHIDLVARNDFTATKLLMDGLAENKKIDAHKNMTATEIIVNDGIVQGVKFGDETIDADGVFILAGQTPATEFLPASNIELDDAGYVKTDDSMMTNIPGVFAAGDVRSGSVKQITVAVGEGATAANNIRKYLEGTK